MSIRPRPPAELRPRPGQRVIRLPERSDARPGRPKRDLILVDRHGAQGSRVHHDDRLENVFEERCDWIKEYGRPDQLAVDGDELSLTYDELDASANRLARYLRLHGAGAGDRIALLFDRPTDGYIAMLAVLKIGGAYVSLDVTSPGDRSAYIVADARAKIVLSRSPLRDLMVRSGSRAAADSQLLFVDEAAPLIAELSDRRLQPAERGGRPSPTAFIVYRSGPDGRPAGVAIDHPSICNAVKVAAEVYGLRSRDRVYLDPSLSSDRAVEQIWATWASGATLVPDATRLRGQQLHGFLTRSRISAVYGTATQLADVPSELPELKLVLLAGEPVPTDQVAPLARPRTDESCVPIARPRPSSPPPGPSCTQTSRSASACRCPASPSSSSTRTTRTGRSRTARSARSGSPVSAWPAATSTATTCPSRPSSRTSWTSRATRRSGSSAPATSAGSTPAGRSSISDASIGRVAAARRPGPGPSLPRRLPTDRERASIDSELSAARAELERLRAEKAALLEQLRGLRPPSPVAGGVGPDRWRLGRGRQAPRRVRHDRAIATTPSPTVSPRPTRGADAAPETRTHAPPGARAAARAGTVPLAAAPPRLRPARARIRSAQLGARAGSGPGPRSPAPAARADARASSGPGPRTRARSGDPHGPVVQPAASRLDPAPARRPRRP